MVRDRGFEPLAPSVSGRCSTTELTAQNGFDYATRLSTWQVDRRMRTKRDDVTSPRHHESKMNDPSDSPNSTGAADMITRQTTPLNLEMPFSSLRDFITPNERFYVRGHFPIPEIKAETWRLKVDGAGANKLELSYAELRQMPARTITATMECAGNGRSFLEPKVKGVEWDLGAVGNAEWTGVLLRDVLERAGLQPEALEAILEGSDKGEIKEPPRPAGEIHYARSVPIGKATADVLLAYEMNGEPLTPEHGFPVRAVVPGWFGMASVKWLQRIAVSEGPFGFY